MVGEIESILNALNLARVRYLVATLGVGARYGRRDMNLTTTIKITYLCGGMNKALVAITIPTIWVRDASHDIFGKYCANPKEK